MTISLLALVSVSGFAAATIYAASFDLRKMSIPNALVLTLLGAFLALAAGSGWSQEEISASLLTASVVLFVGLLIFSLGWSGAGDGKYAAVCALWLGADNVLNFLFMTSVFGAALALLLVAKNRFGPSDPLPAGPVGETGLSPLKISVPYGAAISLGALSTLTQSPWILT